MGFAFAGGKTGRPAATNGLVSDLRTTWSLKQGYQLDVAAKSHERVAVALFSRTVPFGSTTWACASLVQAAR